jgi:hypothetical protein
MGRVVLINSVLDSQLVYIMSALQIPPTTIQLIDRSPMGWWTASLCSKVSGGMGKRMHNQRPWRAEHKSLWNSQHVLAPEAHSSSILLQCFSLVTVGSTAC